DAPVAHADVGLHDAPVVQDDCVGDDEIEDAVGGQRPRGLPHAVADDLAAAELHLVPVHREVALDLDEELGVGEPHPVAHGGAEEIGVLTARDAQAHAPAPAKPPRAARSRAAAFAASWVGPSVRALRPCTSRAPASSTRVTAFSSPGSNRTAVPAGMFSRIPNAWARSKRSSRLASKK